MFNMIAEGVKTMRLSYKAVLSTLIFLVSGHGANAQATWTAWQNAYGPGQVQVSFAQVGNGTWAWKFRNAGNFTILSFTYTYQDIYGQNRAQVKDVEPMTLVPGQIIGGWAYFSCACSGMPMVSILNIEYKK